MGVKRGSGDVSGITYFNRVVAEAIRRVKIALKSDPSVIVPPEDVSTAIGRQVFAPRVTAPVIPATEDTNPLLASRIFGTRITPPPPTTALGTLTFGTHLTSGGASYDGSANVTITPDATSANTASTIMARDANRISALDGLALPSSPASSNANTLDCYAEGTYVTTIALGGGTATLSSSHQTLQYTVTGRKITVHGKISISAVSTPSGSVNIALPVGSGAGTQDGGYSAAAVAVTNAIATWVGPAMGILPNSSSNLAIYEFSAGNVTDPGAKLQVGTDLFISVTFDL